MALSKVLNTDKISEQKDKINSSIDAIPASYSIVGNEITITKEDSTTDTILLPNQRNQVISGGEYTRIHNLAYDIDSCTWSINNVTYTTPSTSSFTFSNGDATYNRYDILICDTNGNIVKIEGSPSIAPEIPTIATDELLLFVLFVPANSTSGDSDANVTFWAGYMPNAPASIPFSPKLYKENFNPTTGTEANAGVYQNSVAIGNGAVSQAAKEVRIESDNIVLNGQYATTYAALQTLIGGGAVVIQDDEDEGAGIYIQARGLGGGVFSVTLQSGEVVLQADGTEIQLNYDSSIGVRIGPNYIRLVGLQTYANNTAAISGGLSTEHIYKTATGELRIVV